MSNMNNKQNARMAHDQVKGIVAAFRKQKPAVKITGSISDCNVVVTRTEDGSEVFRAIKLSRHVPVWSTSFDSTEIEVK